MTAPNIKGPLTIIGLEVENYKRLRAVQLNVHGRAVLELTGKNRQGKTSILDAIWSVLKQADVTNDKPIHDGANRATIRLTLGNTQTLIKAERRFTDKGTTLTLEGADGALLGSPQRLLDSLIGNLSFDPLAFSRMKPAEQYEQLRKIVPLEVDVDKLEGQNAADFAHRTGINRDAKARRATADAMIVPDGLPDLALDEREILDKINGAAKVNAELGDRKARRDRVATEVRNLNAVAQQLKDSAAQLRAQAEGMERDATLKAQEAARQQERLSKADSLPDPVDVAALTKALEHAQNLNAGIAKARQREQTRSEAAALERQAQELTETMEARTRVVTEAIAKAKMPIEGLRFASGQITYNGQPFSQASGAETLMVSMAIGMAANPQFTVILIRDASLLDEDSMKVVQQMAEKHGYQIWMERVSSDQGVGVYIEDGTVVAIDGKKVAAK